MAPTSGRLLFARDPFPDIRWTVAKHDAVAFADPQKSDNLSIHENHVFEVQHEGPAGGLRGEERSEFAHIVGSEPTADSEDHLAVCAALDFQHWSSLLL